MDKPKATEEKYQDVNQGKVATNKGDAMVLRLKRQKLILTCALNIS
jgi:hypothetical protein